MALPTVSGTLSVPPPVFVRKLARRSHWGQPDDEPTIRMAEALQKIFRCETEPEISIYLINSDEDLRRVALGMNAGRDSLSEAIPFVAFLPAELGAVGITPSQTKGNLPCSYANSLHHDIIASDAQLLQLCRTAMQSGRIAGNCTQGMMRSSMAEAKTEGCRTVTSDGTCKAKGC